jgi:hypothetical protein
LFRERAREASRASPAVGELRRVDNAKLDRKRHKPRRPNRCALMPVDLLRHSEISSHRFSPQLQIFLRSIVAKLRFRPRANICLDKDNRTVTIKTFFNYGAR